jgi:hypothetical protein
MCSESDNHVVDWVCPDCGMKNADYLEETAVPLCEACEGSFPWSQIIGSNK